MQTIWCSLLIEVVKLWHFLFFNEKKTTQAWPAMAIKQQIIQDPINVKDRPITHRIMFRCVYMQRNIKLTKLILVESI